MLVIEKFELCIYACVFFQVVNVLICYYIFL